MRNKTQILKHLHPTPPSLPDLTSLLIFSTSFSPAAQGHTESGLQSFHHTLSLPFLPPQLEGSLLSSPAPAWGPTHRRQFSTNFFTVSPSHRLQFFMNCHSASPTGCSPSGTDGSSTSCRWISAPPSASMCYRRTACLTMVFTMGCTGAWSTTSPSFTDLGACRVVSLTYSHFSLLLQLIIVWVSPPPLLKCVIPEALPLSLMGSALALPSGRSVLEPAGTGSIRHRGSFWQLLTEANPVALPTTKTLPGKPNTKTQWKTWFIYLYIILYLAS